MPDTKITALTAIGANPIIPSTFPIPMVDLTDTSMAASGTTKKVTVNQILGAGGTATLASATISGDLTVDTSTLKVDSANNRVGVGTASPAYLLDIADASFATRFVATNTNNSAFGAGVYLKTLNGASMVSNATLATSNDGTFNLLTGTSADSTKLSIGPTGIFTFQNVGGVAGTAMTLNATGLGVGTSPSYKIHALSTSPDVARFERSGAGGAARIQLVNGSGTVWYFRNAVNDLVFNYEGTDLVTFGSSGNVGIGVTPSAWTTTFGLKASQVYNSALASNGTSGFLTNNAYYAGAGYTPTYISASSTPAQGILFNSTGANDIRFVIGAAGTAGNTIAGFSTAAMTLDASGNLGIGVTAATDTRLHIKGGTTGTENAIFAQNSGSKTLFVIWNNGRITTGSDVSLTDAPYNLTTGSAANLFVDSAGVLYRSTSSLKYKTDIADSTRGLADVLKLRPVTYKAKNSGDIVFGGLIAEEVDAAGLTEFVQYAPDNTPDAIHYGNMVSLLVAAIKELTARVQTLETR